eukprot:1547168-Alexandrium_andersonii.AAC.1
MQAPPAASPALRGSARTPRGRRHLAPSRRPVPPEPPRLTSGLPPCRLVPVAGRVARSRWRQH